MGDRATSTVVYEALRWHLEETNPLLYNDLPAKVQEDHGIATAALNGAGRLFGAAGEFKDPCGGYEKLIERLCQRQPEVLLQHIGRFKRALLPIRDQGYSDNLVQCLYKRGIDDEVYRQIILVACLGLFQVLRLGSYSNLLDSMKRDDRIICKVAHSCPSPRLLQAIPEDVLREEHYIIAVVSHFLDVRMDDEMPLLESSSDIPKRFAKSRLLYDHLRSHSLNGFSIPDQFSLDREFCLSCLRGCHGEVSYSTLQVWESIPEEIRNEQDFLSEAVFRNVHVLHHYWTLTPPSETPFNVLLSSIKAHDYYTTLGFDKRFRRYRLADWKSLVDRFDKELKARLDRHFEFTTFLSCIVATRHLSSSAPDDSSAGSYALRLLDCGKETSTGLKGTVASYLGVPTGRHLADLKIVWNLRCQYQDGLLWSSGTS